MKKLVIYLQHLLEVYHLVTKMMNQLRTKYYYLFGWNVNGIKRGSTNNSTAIRTKFKTILQSIYNTVTHNVASITSGHIQKAAGTNGSVVFPFTALASPISYTSTALTPEQEADLMANLYYVNLHSSTFTAGEIRGSIS
jgi:hypothetical protein